LHVASSSTGCWPVATETATPPAASGRHSNVVRRVSNDRDAVEREVVAERACPSARDRGQPAPVGIVPAVGSDPKERPESRRSSLNPGAGLDVPGEKTDDWHPAARRAAGNLRHTGQDLDPRAVADDLRELAT